MIFSDSIFVRKFTMTSREKIKFSFEQMAACGSIFDRGNFRVGEYNKLLEIDNIYVLVFIVAKPNE